MERITLTFVADSPNTSPVNVGISRYFAIRAKNKNLTGQSGIGLLVVGFSWIVALKKHDLLVFNSHVKSFGGSNLIHVQVASLQTPV